MPLVNHGVDASGAENFVFHAELIKLDGKPAEFDFIIFFNGATHGASEHLAAETNSSHRLLIENAGAKKGDFFGDPGVFFLVVCSHGATERDHSMDFIGRRVVIAEVGVDPKSLNTLTLESALQDSWVLVRGMLNDQNRFSPLRSAVDGLVLGHKCILAHRVRNGTGFSGEFAFGMLIGR